MKSDIELRNRLVRLIENIIEHDEPTQRTQTLAETIADAFLHFLEIYTQEAFQMQREAVDAAIEQCAQIAEGCGGSSSEISERIRALKTQQAKQ